MLERIADGRTDLVFDYLSEGHPATSEDGTGVSLIKWCAYYGDVSAIRFLLASGEALSSLGDNLGLDNAAFHGHWRLCRFLIENGADVNRPDPESGKTPLHRAAAFGTEDAIQMLLEAGARKEARDAEGDSPLNWASWHLRPGRVLEKLCFGEFRVHPKEVAVQNSDHGTGWGGMEANLVGHPHV